MGKRVYLPTLTARNVKGDARRVIYASKGQANTANRPNGYAEQLSTAELSTAAPAATVSTTHSATPSANKQPEQC